MRVNLLLIEKPHNNFCLRFNEIHKNGLNKKKKRRKKCFQHLKAKNLTHNS